MDKFEWACVGACLGIIALTAFVLFIAFINGQCSNTPCCGQRTTELFDRIEQLESELRHQVKQKNQALNANTPLKQQVRELTEELEQYRAHVRYGEPLETTP